MTFPDWSGRAAAVVASGASAAAIAPLIPASMPILAVNRSHELVPRAAALYAADSGFWMLYASARAFPGLKYAPDKRAAAHCPDVRVVTIDRSRAPGLVRAPVGVIGHGGNSGYQALNLAVQFGANPIFLVGFDFVGGHWHADHPRALRNPTPRGMAQWAKALDAAADDLDAWGIRVINLSSVSILKRYRKEDATSCLARYA
jgi:hypothetical protein